MKITVDIEGPCSECETSCHSPAGMVFDSVDAIDLKLIAKEAGKLICDRCFILTKFGVNAEVLDPKEEACDGKKTLPPIS